MGFLIFKEDEIKPEERKKLFKDEGYDLLGPDYSYVSKIKYPSDFPVKHSGGLFSMTAINNISAVFYYVDTLLFSNMEETLYSPGKRIRTPQGYITTKKMRKTGGVLGKNYYIKLGKCKNGKDKKLIIINKTGFKSWHMLGLPNDAFGEDKGKGFSGIVPGLLQQLISLNPYSLYMVASGKSKLIECFSNNKSIKIYLLILIILFFIIFKINE